MVNVDQMVYVGIDIHSRKHIVGIITGTLLEHAGTAWQNAETFIIENTIEDYQHLDATIKAYAPSHENVAIAVDHTGGHYSEPIIHFLVEQGYRVCYLETKAVKAIRERFLDQVNKTDNIDAIGAAYILYLRDTHEISFRIVPVSPQLNSTAALFRSLILERQRYIKMALQATNRLHNFLLAVFPEGEAKYFRQLVRIADRYPTPEHILNSNGQTFR
ncbi:MAG: transposase [Dehalococcoidales bacterium]|nr:transposase [Dehalococcoidales bacterium]